MPTWSGPSSPPWPRAPSSPAANSGANHRLPAGEGALERGFQPLRIDVAAGENADDLGAGFERELTVHEAGDRRGARAFGEDLHPRQQQLDRIAELRLAH